MSATEIIEQIEKLPSEEQEKVFAFLAGAIVAKRSPNQKSWLGKKLSFVEACDVVFRENHELLALLAK
ncbi:MAG TPA: hypothetical protein VJA21_10375 [Verrucomicrobiae bacterium]